MIEEESVCFWLLLCVFFVRTNRGKKNNKLDIEYFSDF